MVTRNRKKQSLHERISSAVGAAVVGFIVVAVIVIAIWYELSMWNECFDAGHSFLYCSRVLNK